MAGDVHFEIFIRKGKKGNWALSEAVQDRDKAVKAAEAIAKQNPAFGVRVMKETFNAETGDFMTIKIFDHGDDDGKDAEKIKKEAELMCFQPEDLYSYHARATIGRLLNDILSRWGITVSELMHRADLLEKLEATGTELQHAIQKYAIAHAGENSEPVHDVVRKLNELIQKALERVYIDGRNNRFPKLDANTFAKVSTKLAKEPACEYLLSGSIAGYLASADTRRKKLDHLLSLLSSLPEDEEVKDQCLAIVDTFVSELLSEKAALTDLLGEQPDLGTSLLVMADLFLGRLEKSEHAVSPRVTLLGKYFGEGKLANSRSAIAQRILRELRGVKRLCPDSLEDEVKLVRKLANQVVLGQGPMLSVEDISEAFTVRSKRLVNPNTVEEFLSTSNDPEERVRMLLTLEENIVGTENKRTLAGYIHPILTSYSCERHFLDMQEQPVERFARIVALQTGIGSSGFRKEQKDELIGVLGQLGLQVEQSAGILSGIERNRAPALDKATALMRLCANKVLPDGECRNRARKMALGLIQSTSFNKQAKELRDQSDGAKRLNELKVLMEESGISEMMKAAAA